jgi:hypothetical protein
VRILPAGARVRVDGREISRAGPVLTLPLPAGPHVVEAEHDGARIERAFRVEAGAITNLRTLEVAP